jgi:hypothetical protein
MKRLVETNRWQDNWFVELNPNAKLLLSYLYDCCDEIGSIDLNYAVWSAQLKMDKQSIITSLKELQTALLSDKKKKIFIKDYLKHQKKLPLRIGIEEDDWIINKLKGSLDKFNNAPEILNILNNHVLDQSQVKLKKEKGTKRKIFVEPSFEELKAYYLQEKPDAELDAIKDIYDHYVSCGWTVGKNKPMVDWEACVRKAIRNRERFGNNGKMNFNSSDNNKKITRTETTLSVVDEIKKNS